jgi:hypothetical protein
VKFHSSIEDLVVLAEISCYEKRYLVAFEYLEIAVNLVVRGKVMNGDVKVGNSLKYEKSIQQKQD